MKNRVDGPYFAFSERYFQDSIKRGCIPCTELERQDAMKKFYMDLGLIMDRITDLIT